MVRKRWGIWVTVLFLALTPAQWVSAGWGGLLDSIKKTVGGGESGLSDSRITDGLRQALEIGTANAVATVSDTNGYYGNPSIKIPLPESVRKVERLLRGVGYGSQVDAFELSMNRAAERAAPKAKALFWETIKGMSFSDARKILNGRENEATLYLEEKTRGRLLEDFKPLVHTTMSEVGVTRSYQELDAKVRSIPFAEAFSFDLDRYVTDHALDGLFHMLSLEEQKIRQDPAARVTDLLKDVFGNR
jgi:hypothetical protein